MPPPRTRLLGRPRRKKIVSIRYCARGATSSLFLVLDVAADDLGDVGVLFLGLLDEGRVVLGALHFLDLDVLDLGPVRRLLGAFGLGIGLLERHEFGFLRFRKLRLDRLRGGRARRGGGSGVRTAARRYDHDLIHRAAFRTGDPVLVQVVELGAATGAETSCTELLPCHSSVLLWTGWN